MGVTVCLPYVLLLLTANVPLAVTQQQPCTFCNYRNRPQPIPIEDLQDQQWHMCSMEKNPNHLNCSHNQQRLARRVPLTRHVAVEKARKRMYLDLGAGDCDESVMWFKKEYPQANTFDIQAFEVDRRHFRCYRTFDNVQLHTLVFAITDRHSCVPCY